MLSSESPPVRTQRWIVAEPRPSVATANLVLLLRKAVSAAPERNDLQLQLARALFDSGQSREIVGWLEPWMSDAGTDPELFYHLGRAGLDAGEARIALAALERAADSGFTQALGYLAEARLRLGGPDQALAAGLAGLEASPEDVKSLGVVARILLAQGQRAHLWRVCAGLRERGAWRGYLPSAMAHAAEGARQCAEVVALVDPARWLSSSGPSADARADGATRDFNRELARELLEHRALATLPSSKATTGTGRRLDRLHLQGGPIVRELLAIVRGAVDEYFAERAGNADHPLIARRPDTAALNCWAITVQQDGHETWHVHPDGWLSGVYYVKIPDDPARDRRAGMIEFGPLPFGTEVEPASWPHSTVAPRPGQLLLFPSYYGHRTWPTGVDAPRIVVAFDVLAAENKLG